jgi:hypothetical protein
MVKLHTAHILKSIPPPEVRFPIPTWDPCPIHHRPRIEDLAGINPRHRNSTHNIQCKRCQQKPGIPFSIKKKKLPSEPLGVSEIFDIDHILRILADQSQTIPL